MGAIAGCAVMRPRVLGMRESDKRILEHLANDGRELIDRPVDIAVNIEFEHGTVRHRMPVLRDVGLIQYHDESKGQYKIDDLGRRYLDGEITDDEQDQLEADLKAHL